MNSSNAVAFSLFIVSASMLMFCSAQRRTLLRARTVLNTRTLSAIPPTVSASVPEVPSKSPPAATVGVAGTQETSCEEVCDSCDKKVNDMLGSVKSYDRHIIISVPATSSADWQREIELHDDTFPYNLIRYIEIIKKANKPKKDSTAEGGETQAPIVDDSAPKPLKLKVTAMIEPEGTCTANNGKASVLVYPDNLMFSLQNDQMEQFASFVSQPMPLLNNADLSNYEHSVPAWKKLVLVCVHNARDKRCGRAGPQVISELQRLIDQDSGAARTSKIAASEVAVRGSSHIGGHVYAGTMIMYPEGRWYGRVTKSNSQELLQHVMDDTVYEKCLRGITSSKVLQW